MSADPYELDGSAWRSWCAAMERELARQRRDLSNKATFKRVPLDQNDGGEIVSIVAVAIETRNRQFAEARNRECLSAELAERERMWGMG